MRGMDANEMWITLKKKINDVVEKYVPMKKNTKKERPKWMSNEVERLISNKRKAWYRWKANATEERRREYKELEKMVKRRIRNEKNRMERDIAKRAKENPKDFVHQT